MTPQPDTNGQRGSTIQALEQRARSNRLVILNVEESRDHWKTAGGLEQSAHTGELRTRFLFDQGWDCLDDCRPHLEKKEGTRILAGFEGHEMWVTTVAEEERHRISRAAKRAGVSYVAVPVRGGRILLSTGPLAMADQPSELVETPSWFVTQTMMKLRWLGALSASRGLLPPARKESGLWEAYHPGTALRCWHIHEPESDAKECASERNTSDGVTTGWFVRSTSVWRRVGRFEVTGSELRSLADSYGIKTSVDTYSDQDLLTLEPMSWEDQRFVRLRQNAGWTPPHDNFLPPPLEMAMTVRVRRGAVTV